MCVSSQLTFLLTNWKAEHFLKEKAVFSPPPPPPLPPPPPFTSFMADTGTPLVSVDPRMTDRLAGSEATKSKSCLMREGKIAATVLLRVWDETLERQRERERRQKRDARRNVRGGGGGGDNLTKMWRRNQGRKEKRQGRDEQRAEGETGGRGGGGGGGGYQLLLLSSVYHRCHKASRCAASCVWSLSLHVSMLSDAQRSHDMRSQSQRGHARIRPYLYAGGSGGSVDPAADCFDPRAPPNKRSQTRRVASCTSVTGALPRFHATRTTSLRRRWRGRVTGAWVQLFGELREWCRCGVSCKQTPRKCVCGSMTRRVWCVRPLVWLTAALLYQWKPLQRADAGSPPLSRSSHLSPPGSVTVPHRHCALPLLLHSLIFLLQSMVAPPSLALSLFASLHSAWLTSRLIPLTPPSTSLYFRQLHTCSFVLTTPTPGAV